MSKQLTISATASVCAMALFALGNSLGAFADSPATPGFAQAKGATTVIAAPLGFLRP